MSEQTVQTGRLQEELQWRRQLLENVSRLSAVGACALLVVFIVLGAYRVPIPAGPLITVAAIMTGGSIAAFILNRHGWLQPALILYMLGLTLVLFAGIHLMGGVTGPLMIVLLFLPLLAGQLGGIAVTRWVTGIVAAFWLIAAFLEAQGIVVPVQLTERTAFILHGVTFLIALGLFAVLVGLFVHRGQRGMMLAYERELALAESIRAAQAAVEAEREARTREAHTVAHLRQTIANYAEYLSRVAVGEYTARVDVGELDEAVEGDAELHDLGMYLNTTVDKLVASLSNAQEVQRRYAARAWHEMVEAGHVQPTFAYRQSQSLPEGEWLPEMLQAVERQTSVMQAQAAAVPLLINQQVVGVIGGLHPDGRPWTSEELALIEDVTGQLALTIESLRLLDETQRRAARERLVGAVTARLRETLDVETVLKTAADEFRRALQLERLIVRLGMPAETTDRQDEKGHENVDKN